MTEQEQIKSEARRVAARLRKVDKQRAELLDQRADIYKRSRQCMPPIFKNDLAEIFGVTPMALSISASKR